jgi:hypothetical protein
MNCVDHFHESSFPSYCYEYLYFFVPLSPSNKRKTHQPWQVSPNVWDELFFLIINWKQSFHTPFNESVWWKTFCLIAAHCCPVNHLLVCVMSTTVDGPPVNYNSNDQPGSVIGGFIRSHLTRARASWEGVELAVPLP